MGNALKLNGWPNGTEADGDRLRFRSASRKALISTAFRAILANGPQEEATKRELSENRCGLGPGESILKPRCYRAWLPYEPLGNGY